MSETSADTLLRTLRSIVAEQDAIGSESDRLALQDKLKRRLKRPGVAADDLLQISIQAGYGDPTKLPHNRILISTHAGRRTLLVEHLAEHLAYTADEDDGQDGGLQRWA